LEKEVQLANQVSTDLKVQREKEVLWEFPDSMESQERLVLLENKDDLVLKVYLAKEDLKENPVDHLMVNRSQELLVTLVVKVALVQWEKRESLDSQV